MGLFTRKVESKQQLETMRSELHTMRQRLDEADAVKASLAERLGRLDAEQRAAQPLPAPVGPTLAELTASLDELRAVLAKQQLQIADVAVVATDTAERATGVEAALVANDATELRRQLAQLAERVTSLDARLGQIGTELTNQITELSGEIDAVGSAEPPPTTVETAAILGEIERLMAERIDPHLVDITDGQLRLANEQARYAIQFREDLAELAERIRRPSVR